MAENKNFMPQSTAGLIRYFDEDSGIKIKPEMVVYISLAFTAVVLLIRFLPGLV
ncbi:MAG: preprotein translocase subunit Sec61beta [Candidatus Aenigmatarchaeota archaeon]